MERMPAIEARGNAVETRAHPKIEKMQAIDAIIYYLKDKMQTTEI